MKKLILAMTAASVAVTPGAAMAQRYHGDWGRVRTYDYNSYEPGYNTYYADRYYRPGPTYVMTRGDRIYRGRDGRFYCRRHDGSTGLVVGAAIGAVVGNSLRVGGSRTLGTILGGAAGAALGSSVDRHRLRCR
jgi:hypothetical protein